MTEEKAKTRRPRAVKLHVVTDADGNKIYVKAKTKAAALAKIIGTHFTVETVASKNMVNALDDIAAGAELLTAE